MFIGINLPLEVNGVEGQHRRSRVGHRDHVSDWKRLCEEDASRLRSSWIRLRVGVLSWHLNSSC